MTTASPSGMTGETDVTASILAELADRGLTVAVAESLTGGLLVAELIRPSGASAVVVGGVVAYATKLKHAVLGVDQELLATHGPVDPEVARQMAAGVRTALAVDGRIADIGLSTTGVAGPDPQGGKAPGTVFVGLSTTNGERAIELQLDGDRMTIRTQTVAMAIALLADIDTQGPGFTERR